MANLNKIIYLSEAQKEELFKNGSITVGDRTIVYNDNDIYMTEKEDGEGTSNHNELNNLDYENSGHTGFQATIDDLENIRSKSNSALQSIPSDYKTKTENDLLYQPIGNYVLSGNVYTKSEIDNMIGNIENILREV